MDDNRFPNLPGLETPMELQIPKLKIRLEDVGFNFTMDKDGGETQIGINWVHPMIPIELIVPFKQLFYLEQFISKLQILHGRATEAQASST